MKRTSVFVLRLLVTFALLAGVNARGAAPSDLQRILPFTDPFTVVVARLDLGGIDPDAWAARVLELLPEPRESLRGAVEQAKPHARTWLEEFRKAGGETAYLLVSLSDLGFNPPVAVVVPLADGSDADRLSAMLNQSAPFSGWKSTVARGCVVAAADPVLQRLKALPARPPRQLEVALAAAPSASFQAVLLPYAEAGRVIEEFMPVLPASLGGGSSSRLTRGLDWASLSLLAPPKLSVELLIRSQSAADAEAFAQWIARGLTALGKVEEVQEHLPRWEDVQTILTPRVAGESLQVRLEANQIGELLRAVAMPALQESKAKATRVMVLNNLKQVGLALLLFAEDHDGKFPDHLADTLSHLGGAVSVLLPPGSTTQPPEDFQRQDRAAQVAWLDQHSGLVYLRSGVRLRDIKDPGKTPLVHQKPGLSAEPFVGVCFADGHAESLTIEAFNRLPDIGKTSSP